MSNYKLVHTVQIRRLHPDAIIPASGSEWAAGFDLHALLDEEGDREALYLHPMRAPTLVRTGIAIQLGRGYAAFILPRSGRGHKEGLVLGNTIGLIDGDYTGELLVSAWNRDPHNVITIKPYERIAQLMVIEVPSFKFNVVQEFAMATERGDGGLGSTGN